MADRSRHKRQKRFQQEQSLPTEYRYRRWFVLSLFLMASLSLVVSAVERQVFETDFLQKEGKRRHLSVVKMPAYRGLIKDRRGEVLAVSTPVSSVWVNPRALSPDARTLAPLAKILKMKVDALRALLARYSHRSFVYVKRRISPEIAQRVLALSKEQGVNSFGLQPEYRRYYPTGEVFSHVIGFTDIDDNGQEGLELSYNKILSGVSGKKYVVRDGKRHVVDNIEQLVSPKSGKDLVLSLDSRLQYLAYHALSAAMKRHAAKAASAVVLDVQTGEVLAMVNQPGFNPNGSRNNRGGRLRNRVVTDAYEPGSTMKPFIVAAGLDGKEITLETQIDTAPGYYKIGKNTVRDHHNNGVIDLETLLRKSSNVGASKIALAIKPSDLFQFMSALGFGQNASSEFLGEAAGQLSDFNRWTKIDQATLSFGYGLSVTTLQLAHAYATLANGGVKKPITFFKVEGKTIEEKVISKETADAVIRMLASVVSKEGTAPQAAVEGYRVAGKTGTVKKYGVNGYSDDKYRSVFAGIAPLNHPRLAMAIMIDEPSAGKFYGGDVAGPVFSEVMSGGLRLLNIVPDDVDEKQILSMSALPKKRLMGAVK